jgi:hypothetical protein
MNSHGDNIATPLGFTRVPTDLNESVEGDYIYLFYRKGYDPIEGIAVVAGNSADVQIPEGYQKIDVDLNKGARGKFIYLCFQPGGTKRARVESEIERTAYSHWEKRGCPIGDAFTDWHYAQKMTETRRIANLLWQQRGRPTGDPSSDWMQAEKMVESMAGTAPSLERTSSKVNKPVSQVPAAA